VNTWHNSFSNTKEYQNVFDFGCSLTTYRWVTWSDLIAKSLNAKNFIKTSQPGAGIKYVYQQIKHVSQNYNFTDSDLVLICLPTLDRKDVCHNSDYIHHNMGLWSCKGAIILDRTDSMSPATCMSQGHYGEPRVGIFDMFMENLCYLDLVLKIVADLPCDKIVIHSDAWEYDPVNYLKMNQHYVEHVSKYLESSQFALQDLVQRLSDQYSDTLDTMTSIVNYEDFVTRKQAEDYVSVSDSGIRFVDIDPHPSPEHACEFVKEYFLNDRQCDIINQDLPAIMDNFTSVVSKTMSSSDPMNAHQNTCQPWPEPQYEYLCDHWLFATPEQRQALMHGNICHKMSWPSEKIQDTIFNHD
jgi:hypothetical protein